MANNVDPDEMACYVPFYLDLQCSDGLSAMLSGSTLFAMVSALVCRAERVNPL